MNLVNVQKQQMANFMLGACPFLKVDHTIAGVKLPEFLQREGLVLRIGRDPNVLGMPDLEITDDGWSATLSVQGSRHFVVIPWESVDRMWLEHGPLVVWPAVGEVAVQEEVKVEAEKPALRLVKSE